jgi:hypothetical protein
MANLSRTCGKVLDEVEARVLEGNQNPFWGYSKRDLKRMLKLPQGIISWHKMGDGVTIAEVEEYICSGRYTVGSPKPCPSYGATYIVSTYMHFSIPSVQLLKS